MRNEPWSTLLDDIERDGWLSQMVGPNAPAAGVLVKEGPGLLGSLSSCVGAGAGAFTLYDGTDAESGRVLIAVPSTGSAASVQAGILWLRFMKGLFIVPIATCEMLITYR